MQLRNVRDRKTPELIIIPMIDIMFFLLVFFMLSTLYMIDQQTIKINLPQAASAQTDVVKSLQVTVAKDGRVYLGTQGIEVQELQEILKAQPDKANISMVLRADADVDYAHFIAVLDEMKQCGIQKISLAAKK